MSITSSSGAKPRDLYTVLFSDAAPNGCSRTVLRNYQDYSQVSVNRSVVWKIGDGQLDPSAAAAVCAKSKNEVSFQSMTLLGSMPTPTVIPTMVLASTPPATAPSVQVALVAVPAPIGYPAPSVAPAPMPPPVFLEPGITMAPASSAPAAAVAPVVTITNDSYSCASQGFPASYTGQVVYQRVVTDGNNTSRQSI